MLMKIFKNMRKKLNVKLKIQEPKREGRNTLLDFYIVSGEISVSNNIKKDFFPLIFVNGEEYSETFFEDLRVVVDTKKKNWPECLPFRLIWDENKKNILKGITVYYDFLVFRKDGYYPENGLSFNDAVKQKVHFEI